MNAPGRVEKSDETRAGRRERGGEGRARSAAVRARVLKLRGGYIAGAPPRPGARSGAPTGRPIAADRPEDAPARDDDAREPSDGPGPADQSASATSNAEGALSPEDEAALQAELAHIAADGAAQSGSGAGADTAAQAPPGPEHEAEISRLVGAVNTALDAPEQRRRRASFAHLKAAVAATRADRGGRQPDTSDETEEEGAARPYRDDLADSVSPPRPEAGQARGKGRMPPLMLVSAQRIDARADRPTTLAEPAAASDGNPALDETAKEPETGPDARTRPAETILAARAQSDGFPAFAARMGAGELDELIEAAAVHAIVVQGQEEVTRRQLMRAVSAHLGGSVPREDAQRAVGRLLREGPLRRVRRGVFTVTEDSHYLKKTRG